jgi:signal peptidase II
MLPRVFPKKLRPLSIIILLYLLDQLSKFFIQRFLSPDDSIPLIKNIFHITLVHNTGAAFGMFPSRPHLFVVIAIFAVFFINFILLRKSHILNIWEKFSLYLILAGTLGNLTDRLRFGYVIDFINFRIWPVFNFADTFITIGAVILGLSMLGAFKKKES